ncbi:MAG: VCBS repeat-containing protein [Planctomycetota bacterium]
MLFMMHALIPCALLTTPSDNDKSDQPACHSTASPTINVTRGDRKGEILRKIHETIIASTAPFIGDGDADEARRILERLPPNSPPLQRVYLKARLAEDLLNGGEIQQAIGEFQGALRIMAEQKLPVDERYTYFMRRLGVAYLRLGERQNCVAHHNAESCIFPLSPAAVHVERQGASQAAAIFGKILDYFPTDFTNLWLLNIAHMQLGDYPDGVPAEYRVPPRALESDYDIGRFHDIAPKLGLNCFNRAGDVAMEDFDNDGFLDVIISSMDTAQCLRYFHNNGDGTFAEWTERAQLTGQLGGLHFTHADYDNDGLIDLFVPRGAWFKEFGNIPCSLLKQMPDGTFRDVSEEAGVEVSGSSQVAEFGDIDNDGFLDLFVGFETMHTPDGPMFPSHLFRNRGNGTFEDITEQAGVANLKMCKGAAFGDYDGDGFLDLYVSNLGAANHLYHNNHNLTFTDVALQLGVEDPVASFACWFFDYNNDGALDLLVTNYHLLERGAQVAAYYKNRSTGIDHTRLYENDGHGSFTDVSVEKRLDRTFFPMGCNFGDLDNDGYPDLYFGTGDPDFTSLWPNIMLRNDRGRSFQDVTTSGGFGHLQKGHGICFADLDNDGDQDVFAQLGGAVKDDRFWDALFENPGHGNHWLTIRLTGVKTNKSAIGARIRAHIVEPTGERDVYAYVGCGSSFGNQSLQQEMGMGRASKVAYLEVFWPVTGLTQRFENVPLDKFIHIDEGAKSFTVENRKVIKF